MATNKLRSINTHFWNDNYIVGLDPIEKLLFLYLLTNENTNMLGIYELNLRRIAFDTGIDKDMLIKIFERFSKDGRMTYLDGYVILHKFIKHQRYNQNMLISAIRTYNDLPPSIKHHKESQSIINNLELLAKGIEPITKGIEPITKPSEPLRKIEIEVEGEIGSRNIYSPDLPKDIEAVEEHLRWYYDRRSDLLKNIRLSDLSRIASLYFDDRHSKGWKLNGTAIVKWKNDVQNYVKKFDDGGGLKNQKSLRKQIEELPDL